MNRVTIALLAWVLSTVVWAAPQHFESPVERVSLVELYTSEGCSSCPPADHWLGRLRADPRLWREIIPLAFHVDYWNYLGWPDRFARRAYTERQRQYRARGGVRTIYTPQFVVAGREWRGWFSRPVLRVGARPAVGRLRVERDANRLRAFFHPLAGVARTLDVHVALLGFGLRTRVRAGENQGRNLRHDFVVLGHGSAPLRRSGQVFAAPLDLPATRVVVARTALVAWVSARGNPAPIQATGGWVE